MKMKHTLRTILTAALLPAVAITASAFGPEGHEFVGAIADEKLDGTLEQKIDTLLDGISLADAALLPDKIKTWDRKPPDRANTFHMPDHPGIEAQLVDFWKANPPDHNNVDTKPSHHWFHYTDVPVGVAEKYADGTTGRLKWDIVHMIPFCISVLKGETPVSNDRKITKPVAVILLAHFVGDIHQPLHVGAEYFDQAGHKSDPDHGGEALSDQGGNLLLLTLDELDDHGHHTTQDKLHSYWDGKAVSTAFHRINAEIMHENPGHSPQVKPIERVKRLAKKEPEGWSLPAGDVLKWSEAWADEILPIAREAHEKLNFTGVHVSPSNHKEAQGMAAPKAGLTQSYPDWAGEVIERQLHKAGWRLAALLKEIL